MRLKEKYSCVEETRSFGEDSSTRGSKRRRPLGRPRLRWEDCIKRDATDFQPDTN